jgi:hypothetical protein
MQINLFLFFFNSIGSLSEIVIEKRSEEERLTNGDLHLNIEMLIDQHFARFVCP